MFQRNFWTRGIISDKMDAEALAKQLEMEAMADMFTKMTDSCHNKCISKFYK